MWVTVSQMVVSSLVMDEVKSMAVLVCWLSNVLNETVALQQLHQTYSVHVVVHAVVLPVMLKSPQTTTRHWYVASWSNTADRSLKKIVDIA